MAEHPNENASFAIPVAGPALLPKRSLFTVFFRWRMAVIGMTGFACGLPNALTAGTLKVWLTQCRVSIEGIGLLALVALPYSLKFLWSPLMDRFALPVLGRRRGWMILSQAALIGGLATMALVGGANPLLLAAIALLVAFFGASQDIATDAYRTELLGPAEIGAGAAMYMMGYRLGMLASKSAAPILAGQLSWRWAYLLMAGAMLVGVVATAFGPEPASPARPPQTLGQAIVKPFAEFLRRRGAFEMILFILIFKLDWLMVSNMIDTFITGNPASGGLGFTSDDYGIANAAGIFATIGGAAISGLVITRIGIRRSLWTFGLFQALAGLSFTTLALVGKSFPMMVLAVSVENLCSGMVAAAFVGFLMSLCNRNFTATQYALLTGLMTLGGQIATAPAGWIVRGLGWPAYFVISTVIAAPGLLLLTRFRRWQEGTEAVSSNEGGKNFDF